MSQTLDPQLTAQLASFVDELGYDDLPRDVAIRTKALIADAIGCALAGWDAEEIEQVVTAARALSVVRDSTIIGSAVRASPLAAALANGYLVTGVTCCDVYTPAHFHLTPEVVPAALCVAEMQHATGEQLLTAVAAGLEVSCRIAHGIDYQQFRSRGWHSPGVVGPIGAAVAAAKLLGLDANGIRRAIALAVSQAAGTFASWPTTAVKFHQGRAGMAGLMSALLASEGMESAAEPITAPDGGLLAAYGPGDPAVILESLGRAGAWELMNVSFRLWPGATPVQSLLTALLAPAGGSIPERGSIATLRVQLPPATYAAHRIIAPTSSFDALLSFSFVAAAVVRYGYFWTDLVTPEVYRSPEIARFATDRVELVADPAIPFGGLELHITTTDGSQSVVTVDAALGTPRNPVTGAQLDEKFLRCAEGRIGRASGESLLALLHRLEEQADCAALLERTRPAPATTTRGDSAVRL